MATPQETVSIESLQADMARMTQTIGRLTERLDAAQPGATGGTATGSVPAGENPPPSVNHLEFARRDLKLKLGRFNGKLQSWHTWRQEFLLYASLYNFLPALTREPPIRTAPLDRVH